MKRRKIVICFLFITSLLSACGGYYGQDDPEIVVQGVRAVPSAGFIPNFVIDLNIVNPNRSPIHLNGVFYTLHLEGHRLFTGATNDLPDIEGFSEGSFSVNANPDLLSGLGLVADLFSRPRNGFEYAIDAKLDVGGFRRNFNVYETGLISFPGGSNRYDQSMLNSLINQGSF